MVTMKLCVVFAVAVILHFSIANAFRIFTIGGVEIILASENENIHIECKSDFPIIYCGFVHPSGKRFSFTERTVSDGKCVQKIKATKSDSGEWGCHIGRKSERLETIKKIEVRIVNQVAALEPNITAKLGRSITIACATTKGLIPLSYCRFEPPTGRPFNIDSSVTAENSILGKYYFPSNANLDRGDCAVTIIKVQYEDVGLWSCGAGLGDGKEYIDNVKLDLEGMYKMSTASETGVTVGGILVAIALGSLGYIAWKKRSLLGGRTPPRPEVIELQEVSKPSSSNPRPGSKPPTPRLKRSGPAIEIQSPPIGSDPGMSPLIKGLDSETPKPKYEISVPAIVIQSPSIASEPGVSPLIKGPGSETPKPKFEISVPAIVIQSPSIASEPEVSPLIKGPASETPKPKFEISVPAIVIQSPSIASEHGMSPLSYT